MSVCLYIWMYLLIPTCAQVSLRCSKESLRAARSHHAVADAAIALDQQPHIQDTSTAVTRPHGRQGRARGRSWAAAQDRQPARRPRRYELHHGVRINDGALVEAAVMSDRYIADRFLPDKAIDLVDEAAAKLKMEITSKPVHLDEIDRKVLQLEMERLSLTKARAAWHSPAPLAAAADASPRRS